jgi:uncharacterized membrane protein YgcG
MKKEQLMAELDADIARLDELRTALQTLATAAPPQPPAALPAVDLTDYVSIQAYIDRRKAEDADITFEQIGAEIAAMVRQAKSADPNSPIQIRPATISEELRYYGQLGGRTQDTLRHDLNALEKIPVFLADETDPCKLDAKWRAMELPFVMAVRNRHISEEDLKTALMSRMQGNAEQFLLAQPNITNMTFDQIMTLCRQRFYVTENQAAARTKNTYQLDKESVQVYAERSHKWHLCSCFQQNPLRYKGLVVRNNPDTQDGLTAMPIPNPFQQEDALRYNQEVKMVGRTLIIDFVKGLKTSIRQKLHSIRLDELSFQEVVAAAVREEQFAADFPESTQRSAYALETTKNEQAFATRGTGCYQCNDPNHWIKDCPQLKGATSGGKRGSYPARGQIWTEQNYNFSRDNRSQTTTGNNNRFPGGRGGRGFPHNKGSRGGRGSFRGNWRNLPKSFRNNNRRKWMNATRAALNKRLRYRQRVYNLTEEENEADITYTEEEEEELFQLEAEAENDPEWHQQYINDVAKFEDEEDGESKNA